MGYFLPFYLPKSPKNQNLERKKKAKRSFYNSAPKIMIICCTLPEIWYMTDVIIFHFGLFFALLLPQQPRKSKFWKHEKEHLEISSFYISLPKILIICYTVPEIWHLTDVIVIFLLSYFFPFYSPNNTKNQNFEKMESKKKNTWIYHQFTYVYQKSWSYAVLFLRSGMWHM